MQRMHLALQRSAPLSEQGKRRGTRMCTSTGRGQSASELRLMTAGEHDVPFRHVHPSEICKDGDAEVTI